MIYMLDTNTVIYILKNKPPEVKERFNALEQQVEVCMSFVTWAELLAGAARSTQAARTEARLHRFAAVVGVRYASDATICRHYAEQFGRLKIAGTPIGANDLWIAAHALACGAVLVSNNLKEFQRIDGLRVENWVG